MTFSMLLIRCTIMDKEPCPKGFQHVPSMTLSSDRYCFALLCARYRLWAILCQRVRMPLHWARHLMWEILVCSSKPLYDVVAVGMSAVECLVSLYLNTLNIITKIRCKNLQCIKQTREITRNIFYSLCDTTPAHQKHARSLRSSFRRYRDRASNLTYLDSIRLSLLSQLVN